MTQSVEQQQKKKKKKLPHPFCDRFSVSKTTFAWQLTPPVPRVDRRRRLRSHSRRDCGPAATARLLPGDRKGIRQSLTQSWAPSPLSAPPLTLASEQIIKEKKIEGTGKKRRENRERTKRREEKRRMVRKKERRKNAKQMQLKKLHKRIHDALCFAHTIAKR